jgi:SAM-dependent methyltransferase
MESDVKFVEWSSAISSKQFDVEFLSEVLNRSRTQQDGLDFGGGTGRFAEAICQAVDCVRSVTIVEPSLRAFQNRVENGRLHYIQTDLNSYSSEVKYDFIIMRTVLHHLVGDTERKNLTFQSEALLKARGLLKDGGCIFVLENFYDGPYDSDSPGLLIYLLTRSTSIKRLVRFLGANTAGEGVRFRSRRSWNELFRDARLRISEQRTLSWHTPWWQRLLLIKAKQQCALVLRPYELE